MTRLLVVVGVLTLVAPSVPLSAQEIGRLPFATALTATRSETAARTSPLTFRIAAGRHACGRWRVMALAKRSSSGPSWRHVQSSTSDGSQAVVLQGTPGDETLVVAECPGQPGYSFLGPFVWNSSSIAEQVIDIRPRRTVRVSFDGSVDGVASTVLPGEAWPEHWPQCEPIAADQLECVGVPLELPVLVLVQGHGLLRWVIAKPEPSSIQVLRAHVSNWGRLLRLVGNLDNTTELEVNIWQETHRDESAWRMRTRYTRDDLSRIHQLSPRLLWIEASGEYEARFLELKGETIATIRIDLGVLLGGRPEAPYAIHLAPPLRIVGRTVDADGRPAEGTLVSLFEFVNNPNLGASTPQGGEEKTKRWIAETKSDSGGRFTFAGPVHGLYEFLAVHPTLGRAVVEHRVDARPLTIPLRATARLRGRVLRGREPVSGAIVRTVPDATDLAGATDPLSHLSLGGLTDLHGAFTVSLPPRGSGTIVVGGGAWSTVRQRYSNAETWPPLTDLGDIVLPPMVELNVRLLGGDCELYGVGPLGSLGLSQVRAVYEPPSATYGLRLPEGGFWWLEAECGGEAGSLVPPIVRIPADGGPGLVFDTVFVPADSAQ